MFQFSKEEKRIVPVLPCLVCGVDSGPVLTFFFWLIGGVLFSFSLVLVWAIANKKFAKDKMESFPLHAEERN